MPIALLMRGPKGLFVVYEFGTLSPGVELKAAGDAWEVSGYLSTFGNTDRGGDVMMPGAFDRTLREIDSLPLLLGHDMGAIAGASKELRLDERGLFARFAISRGPTGTDAHELLAVGGLKAFSIGYVTRDAEFTEDNVRKLIDVDLLEGSLLPSTMPMNVQAVVTGFKAFNLNDDVPFDVLLKQIIDGIDRGTTEAEALWARRLSDGREPTATHLDAVRELFASVKAVSSRLEDLVLPAAAKANDGALAEATPEDAANAASASALSAPDLRLRLQLARHRLRLGGLLERAS